MSFDGIRVRPATCQKRTASVDRSRSSAVSRKCRSTPTVAYCTGLSVTCSTLSYACMTWAITRHVFVYCDLSTGRSRQTRLFFCAHVQRLFGLDISPQPVHVMPVRLEAERYRQIVVNSNESIAFAYSVILKTMRPLRGESCSASGVFCRPFRPVEPCTNECFIVGVHFVRHLADRAMVRCVVFEGEIAVHRFQRASETLDHACFVVFVLRSVEMYAVMAQHLL